MQSTRPPLDTTFFKVVQGRRIALSPALRAYFRRLTRNDPAPELLEQLRMEEFFNDLYFDFQESPNDVALRQSYTDLVDLYLRVLRETTNWLCADGRRGAPIGRLIATAAEAADTVDIVTFNHDLVIENEIFRRARLSGRWCLDEGYGAISESMQEVVRTGVPTFHTHGSGVCDHTRPIRILKLHGSLNWRVRINSGQPTARMLSGQSGPHTIQLLNGRTAPGRATYGREGRGGRGRSSWTLWPIVIPPIYAKQAMRKNLQATWLDAQSALETADRVVFFGYSLPAIDIDAEKLFERAMARNRHLSWIDVVNPEPASAQRYAALGPRLPVRWYPRIDGLMAEDSTFH